MTDYGLAAQKAAEKHLDACWEALGEDDEDFDDVDWPDMAGPFCGCQTCVVREVLHAAWPVFERSVGTSP